ncbi:hypothetical protein [Lachnotalea sp. AF33-28]|uniref:hypothetical protein n=1 Tax=Lachnotalea sp. AF33-28 TaxID=2292046 RepID=UPI000E50AE4C|nr:hypothetical protein [Lachnotalea sp. AF33-28]RHP34559.1 hypothetical protein DWZ56_07955 [Lachnotalea sp. AF33-28]
MKYADRIRAKIAALSAAGAALLLYAAAVGQMGNGSGGIRCGDWFCRAALCCGLLFILYKILHQKKLLKDVLLKQLDGPGEKERRRQRLYDKSGGIQADLFAYMLLIFTCTAAVSDRGAFQMAAVILTLNLLLRLCIYICYDKLRL